MIRRWAKWLGSRLVPVAGFVLTAGSLLLYYGEPAPIQKLSLAAYDGLVRATHRPLRGGHVVVVDIDEASLARYGQWPWPRYLLARLTRALMDHGASVVAFDIVFKEADRTSPEVYLADLRRDLAPEAALHGLPPAARDFELLFADALEEGDVVLGCFLRRDPLPGEPALRPGELATLNCLLRPGGTQDHVWRRLPRARAADLPRSKLREAAAGIGFINAEVDSDNVIRRYQLLWTHGEDGVSPSLGLEALRLHLDQQHVVVEYDATGLVRLGFRGLDIPTDRRGQVLLRYRSLDGRGRSSPYLSASSVLDGSVDRDAVEGRIVFVGASAMGLHDLKATPMSGQFAGVETHAVLVDNVLSGDVLRQPAEMELLEIVAIVLAGCLVSMVIHLRRPWLAMCMTAFLLAAALTAGWLLMDGWNLVFVPTRLIAAVVLLYLVLTSIRYWQEESGSKQLRQMFAPMVSTPVMKYMEEHPESYSLSGRDTDTSVLFSDLAGFTPIAERLTAESVTGLLNTYFSRMNRLIQQRNGYVDKFQGDGLMAVWGAPYPMSDHAAQACLCALEQQREVDVLREAFRSQYGIELSVRIGINSGRVKAGNMGAADRNQYTVIGDAVNLAARLEPVNKQYRTAILIGEETFRRTAGAIEARLIDRILVKGKSEPVRIYEVLAPAGELGALPAQVARWYEQALRAYWKRDWDHAQRLLDAALHLAPDDGPARSLQTRLAECRRCPPAPEWNGVTAPAAP